MLKESWRSCIEQILISFVSKIETLLKAIKRVYTKNPGK